MEYSEELNERKELKQRAAKPLLWVSMVGIGMAFAGLTSAYIIRQADTDWLSFELPAPFYISTALIILSSITMFAATAAAKKDNQAGVVRYVSLTLILGIGFIISQFFAYSAMVDRGLHMVGTSVSSSFHYVITGFHLAHVLSGIIVLIVTLVNAKKEKYSADNHLGLSLASSYWHFLDFLWIFLIVFLAFIR